MSSYRNLLVLVDLTADSDRLIERALKVRCDDNAVLHLLHVVEYVPLEPMGETMLPNMQLEKELLAHARQQMQALAARHGVDSQHHHVVSGSIKQEVMTRSQQWQCDLIVVGNHQRHGLRVLLNFTEDAVLHVAPCDVLAVHL